MNIDPRTNDKLKRAHVFADDEGNIRVLLLTVYGQLVVGYRRSDEKGLPRIITSIPGQNETRFDSRVNEEQEPDKKTRFISLGSGVHEIPLDEYPQFVFTS